MASNIWAAQSADTTVAAATTRTILQVYAANSNVREAVTLVRLSIRGGTMGDPPVLVELLRQTSAGTGGTTVTPVHKNPSAAETLQLTALSGPTSEPTAGDLLDYRYASPVLGEVMFTTRQEMPGGGRLAVRVTTQASVSTITCKALMEGDE
jgi:hypothetical protein